jgi:hypothetical protein
MVFAGSRVVGAGKTPNWKNEKLLKGIFGSALPSGLSQHGEVLAFEADFFVMFLLIADVLLDVADAGFAHGETAVTLLPSKVGQCRVCLMNPL